MYHLTLPKSLVLVRRVSSPNLSFPMRAQLGAGRPWEGRLNPEGRVPTPPGWGACRTRELSRGPAPDPRALLRIPRPGVRPALPPIRGTWCLFAFIFHFCFGWGLLSFFFWSCFDFPQKQWQCLRPDPLLRRIMIFRCSSPFPRCHSISQGTRNPSGSRGREQPAHGTASEAAPLPSRPLPRARSHAVPMAVRPRTAAGPARPDRCPAGSCPRWALSAPGCADRPRTSLTSRAPEPPPRLRLEINFSSHGKGRLAVSGVCSRSGPLFLPPEQERGVNLSRSPGPRSSPPAF